MDFGAGNEGKEKALKVLHFKAFKLGRGSQT